MGAGYVHIRNPWIIFQLVDIYFEELLFEFKVSQDTKIEVVKVTRQRVKAEQDLENFKSIQERKFREHEQVGMLSLIFNNSKT